MVCTTQESDSPVSTATRATLLHRGVTATRATLLHRVATATRDTHDTLIKDDISSTKCYSVKSQLSTSTLLIHMQRYG